jgi:flagellar motor switch protein FliM
VRKTESTEAEQERVLRLLQEARLHCDARLLGPGLDVEHLMHLEVGDLLHFDFSVERDVDLMVNGKLKYRGQIVRAGNKRAFHISRCREAPAEAG